MAKTILQLWHKNFDKDAGADQSANTIASGNAIKGLRHINSFNENEGSANINQNNIYSGNPIPSGRSFSILAMLATTGLGALSNQTASAIFDPSLPNQSKFGSEDRTFDNFQKSATVLGKILLNNNIVQSPPNVKAMKVDPAVQGVSEVEGVSFQRNVVRNNKRIGAQENSLSNWSSYTDNAGVDYVSGTPNPVVDFNSLQGFVKVN